MKIQEFKAATATEALKKVQQALGANALIISTKNSSTFGGGVVVTAALSDPGEKLRTGPKVESSLTDSLQELRSEVESLRDSLTVDRDETISWAPGVADLDRRLRANGVSPRLRRKIVENAARRATGAEILAAAQDVIAEFVPVWPAKGFENKPRILSFIGPTGAGKTTTLAKLAGRLVHEAKKRVALVTVDTYRVAAVEQIRAYSDMLAMPLSVVFTPTDAAKAVAQYQDFDVILVDTAGRSPYDTARLRELAGFLNVGQEIETLLVLAATTSPDVAEEIIDRFPITPSSALVLTKLDETKKPGALLELFIRRGLPLAYLADGQEVPADLERATSEKIGKRILAAPEMQAVDTEVSL